MRPTVRRVRLGITWACICAAVVALYGRSAVSEPVSEPSPAPVDEQLFLVRVLEQAYLDWPVDWNNAEPTCDALAAIEIRLARCYEHIEARQGMDPKLKEMFGDARKLAEEYADTLIRLGVLEKTQYQKRRQEMAMAAGSTLLHAVLAARSGARLCRSPWGALWGLPVAVKQGYYEYCELKEQEEIDRLKLLEVRSSYEAKQSGVLARAEERARYLEVKYKWGNGESGFVKSGRVDEQTVLRQRNTARYRDELNAGYRDCKRSRPRDPFVSYGLGMSLLAACEDVESPERKAAALREAAAEFERAAQLIPAHPFYQVERVSFLLGAAQCHADISLWSGVRSERALQLTELAFTCDPADLGGPIRRVKAHGLARAGRVMDAVKALDEIKDYYKGDAAFALDQARFLCLAGDHDLALGKLDLSLQYGCEDVIFLRACPDLAALRSQRARHFADLTRVETEIEIDFKYTNELCLKNKSRFPLTNVFLHVIWTSNDGTEKKYILYTPGPLNRQATHYWWDVPQGAVSTEGEIGSAVVRCDQMRDLAHEGLKELAGYYWGWGSEHYDRDESRRARVRPKTSFDERLDINDKTVTLRGVPSDHLTNAPNTFEVVRYSHGVIEAENGTWAIKLWTDGTRVTGDLSNSEDGTSKALWLEWQKQ